jgi:hypothetical protein
MLDELDEMAHEGAAPGYPGMPPEAATHRAWWASISEDERGEWRRWLRKDIQADELGLAPRRRKQP